MSYWPMESNSLYEGLNALQLGNGQFEAEAIWEASEDTLPSLNVCPAKHVHLNADLVHCPMVVRGKGPPWPPETGGL